MKKLVLIAAVALAGLTAVYAATSTAETTASQQILAPQAKKSPKPGIAPKVITTPKSKTQNAKAKGGVIKLTDDKKYRPGMKVTRLTILDFNATWCGPCKQFAPAFEQAAAKFAGKADFISIDTDANPATAKAFGIEAIPTVIFLYPNGQTKKFIGTGDILPAEKFISTVQKAL